MSMDATNAARWRAGLLAAVLIAGGGGYWLAKEPRDITVGEIIRLTDGPLAPVGGDA